jgi:hypothetical protein
MAERISQREFNRAVETVEQGASVGVALQSIEREDIAESTMRRWLRNAGVETQSSGNPAAYSATQIEVALQARADHISRTGSTRGSSRAAYAALGSSAGNWSTFRDYVNNEGLTAHGKSMLDRASAASSSRGAGNPD